MRHFFLITLLLMAKHSFSQEMSQIKDGESAPHLHGSSGSVSKVQKITIPDVFVIGAMKCATTSFQKLLTENNAICEYGEKEKHFFNSAEYKHNYKQHVGNYYNEYKGCKAGQLRVDNTPGYAVNGETIGRVKESYELEELAKKKFIILLREPVARHYSEYQMAIRLCLDTENDLAKTKFTEWRTERHDTACRSVSFDYDPKKPLKIPQHPMTVAEWSKSEVGEEELRRGHYKDSLTRWLEVIRRDQLMVINFQALIHNTTDVMVRVAGFLGVKKPWSVPSVLPHGRAPAASNKLDCKSAKFLKSHFDEENGDLVEFINSGSGVRSPYEADFEPFEDAMTKCANFTSDSSTSSRRRLRAE